MSVFRRRELYLHFFALTLHPQGDHLSFATTELVAQIDDILNRLPFHRNNNIATLEGVGAVLRANICYQHSFGPREIEVASQIRRQILYGDTRNLRTRLFCPAALAAKRKSTIK